MRFCRTVLSLVVLLWGSFAPTAAFPSPSTSRCCRHCHSTTSSRSGRQDAIVLFESFASSIANLPSPPSKGGFLRRFRDTFAYLKDPDRFIAERSQELGPVFLMYQFFAPTVIVGGQDNVREFIKEVELQAEVIYPSLPESFLDLHTKWGTLNLDANDQLFKEARGLFKDVLSSRDALVYHTKTVEPLIEDYVNKLVQRVRQNPQQEFFLVPEVLELCLQIFSRTFSGKGLTDAQVQMFLDYNKALLSLSTNTKQFKDGKQALETLKVEMLERFQALGDPAVVEDAPGKFYHSMVDGREGFEDEDRICSVIVLFIWGAYVECASLMLDAMAQMQLYGQQDGTNVIRESVVKEYQEAKASGLDETDYAFWMKLPYTIGVMREALRLEPPGAGVARSGPKDFALAGYRIPAGIPVMLDPRIGNKDPNLYEQAEQFEPLRWVPGQVEESASKCPFAGTATKLGPGSWFPGGNGAHKCPGVPLAEIVGSMFIAKVSERLSWKFSGSGLKDNGEIDFVKIPVKILPNNFGLYFEEVEQSSSVESQPSRQSSVA